MYHSIAESKLKGVHPYYETSTSPTVFAEHMKFLCENNYKVITLDQAVKIIKKPDPFSHPMNASNASLNKP